MKQWTEDKNESKKTGGYVTKQWLIDNRSYTKCLWLTRPHACIRVAACSCTLRSTDHMYLRTMADNAFEWAKSLGRWRMNAIHKTEEADIPYDEMWSVSHSSGTRVDFESNTSMEEAYLNSYPVPIHTQIYV